MNENFSKYKLNQLIQFYEKYGNVFDILYLDVSLK